MRIAIFNRYGVVVGGAERYLTASLSRLSDIGHEIRFYCEKMGDVAGRPRVWTDRDTELVPAYGTLDDVSGFAARLKDWRPDVISVHSQLERATEESVLGSAPSIFFAHSYTGTCISGGKTLHDPAPRPCNRALGPLCLAHYYPHRCGGLNPRSMMRGYSRNRQQLAALHRYEAVVIFSSHMKAEFLRNGIDPSRLKLIPPFNPAASTAAVQRGLSLAAFDDSGGPLRIGFIGRLEADKGVGTLIRSLPRVARDLGRNIEAKIAGDGQRSGELQRLAKSVSAESSSGVRFDFIGWIESEEAEAFFSSIDLLVVPSVWPEPFGLVGLEAAHYGVPAAAFAVGGIPDWLIDGRNGHLANGERPTPEGLAGAIIKCVRDPVHYARLSEGALQISEEFSAARHMTLLSQALENAARRQSV